MAFLRNAWYVAGWESELDAGSITRTMLGDPIIVIRQENSISAFFDACPHRFAPLSKGRIADGVIQCAYHGLKFDMAGRCIANPHGNGARPASLKLRSYPVIVREGIVWLWMGDAESMRESEPPSFPFLVDPVLKTITGYLFVNADYQLVVDNLLDLSHVEFLHPFLSTEGGSTQIRYKAVQSGSDITAFHHMDDQPNSPLFRIMLGQDVDRVDGRAHMHWQAPANLWLDTGATSVGKAEADGASMPQAHLLTPETESTCHYFWGVSRDRAVDDNQVNEMLRFGIANAFENEDEPMIRSVQQRMQGRDLFELSPALLPMDEASVRARRTLKSLISAEQ